MDLTYTNVEHFENHGVPILLVAPKLFDDQIGMFACICYYRRRFLELNYQQERLLIQVVRSFVVFT